MVILGSAVPEHPGCRMVHCVWHCCAKCANCILVRPAAASGAMFCVQEAAQSAAQALDPPAVPDAGVLVPPVTYGIVVGGTGLKGKRNPEWG